MQVGFDGEIGAEALDADVGYDFDRGQMQGGLGLIRGRVAGEDGRVEEADFVNQAGGEGGLIERWAGFEQDVVDVAAGEFGENFVQDGARIGG